MLPFSDKPYTYQPPNYFAPTAWALRTVNRLYRLPRTFRVRRFDLVGPSRPFIADGPTRTVLVANHSTHIDAPLLIEACRRVGVVPRTMAAYDVYLRGTIDAWTLRRLGCFSVDREATDKAALDEAARTVEQGRYPLALFPEGNVYLENDHVTPFQDGASLLAVRAAKSLQERDVRVLVQPIAIKLSHLTDCRPILRRLIGDLARFVGVTLDPSWSAAQALGAIAQAALRRELAGRGLTAPQADVDLPTMVRSAASGVLDALERKLGLEPKPQDEPMSRVLRCRRIIHEVRLDPARAADHRVAETWADEAMLAFRIASYSPHYVADRPTLDRIGEWVEKVYEDLHDRILPAYADRAAFVRFVDPIDVTAMLASGAKQKQLIGQLTERMEQSVQCGLDDSNAANRLPGGMVWEDRLSA